MWLPKKLYVAPIFVSPEPEPVYLYLLSLFSSFYFHFFLVLCGSITNLLAYKRFQNCLEWNMEYNTGLYIWVKIQRVAVWSPLHLLGTGAKSSNQAAWRHFLSAFRVHRDHAQKGPILKAIKWMKEFPQQKFFKWAVLFSIDSFIKNFSSCTQTVFWLECW